MKEIKAYVRVEIVQQVVDALERKGFCCMTVIDVSALGNLADPAQSKYSLEFVERYSKKARIELVCKDSDADTVVEVIQKNGCTHQHGDGIIFVLPVERAVKIRTAAEGDEILQMPSAQQM
ncbi:MAG: P-II family nitrogen regulator [Bacteroidota bacterium]|nr:P-II family nitrogen regulator [Bacteroidota bacterium]